MAPSSDSEYDPSKDPKRKPKSKDPGWKYGFWPDLSNKDIVQCTLCNKKMHSGIRRLKQHLGGGKLRDVATCPKTTPMIMREMHEYIKRTVRNEPINFDDDDIGHDGGHDDVQELPPLHPQQSQTTPTSSTPSTTSIPQPSSGTAAKRKHSMLHKSPEEVVATRRRKGTNQSSVEHCFRPKELKERVHMHIANFFYECGIPFNAANSRSFEIMIESIGQYGPGLKPPTYHELRVPLLEKAKKETDELKKKHEAAWERYGCTLMSDGWTDKRGCTLINFFANSPEGTFFLESIDASSQYKDKELLAKLLEEKIEAIGKDKVVQVVTDNNSNYKAAGKILMKKYPTLFWTPCAAHCLDLMLEDIGKLPAFKTHIDNAKRVTTFIYRHPKILDVMREKTGGRDLVQPGATRFVTAFLTLQSMYKSKDALRQLFDCEEWKMSMLANTEAGKKVYEIVMSTRFWTQVEDCIRASQPLLIVLRMVDGDERPAMPEVSAAMDHARKKLMDSFENKIRIGKSVLEIFERRWKDQMKVKLYGAALFLNQGKFYEMKATEFNKASKIYGQFNDVLWKMVNDDVLQQKISSQADDYFNMRGCFEMPLAIKQQKTKNPLDWWIAFAGEACELQTFALRILGLCCSSSGCERNWSTFEFIHTKRRNKLEHKRLNDLVYIQYNRKITSRFQKRREEGTNFQSLVLEEFQWDNEWVDASAESDDVHSGEDFSWTQVDEAIGASQMLEDRTHLRRGQGGTNVSSCRPPSTSRLVDESDEEVEVEPPLNDDEDVEDDYGVIAPPTNNGDNAVQIINQLLRIKFKTSC